MILALDALPDDAASLKVLIAALHAEAQTARADNAHLATERDVLAAEVDRLIARNERLDHIISVLRRRPVRRPRERLRRHHIGPGREGGQEGAPAPAR